MTSAMTSKTLLVSAIALLAACAAEPAPKASAQEQKPASTQPTAPEIAAEIIRDNIYLLTGPGGNIGVSVGDDGVFVIDDKFDRFGDQIISNIKDLSDDPIRFVINTHYHGDHTGANAEMKKVGASIVAHDNVRKRMGMTFDNKLFGRPVKAAPSERWPTITFSDTTTFYFNEQTARVIHVPNAHTDGDSLIYFEEANILHMGDNFFHGMFPYVDIDGGGSLQGMIDAHATALSLIDENSVVIPGHGPLASKSDLNATREMLMDVQNRVAKEIEKRQYIEDILAAEILSDLNTYAKFIDEEKMVLIAHRSLRE